MSKNPFNLLLRFLLEVTALIIFAIWGWKQGVEEWRYLMVVAVPILMATLWGVFTVPNDPSRSGKAPVPTPGVIRLIIELLFFGMAVWACWAMGFTVFALCMGMVTLLHYLVSIERIKWLVKQ